MAGVSPRSACTYQQDQTAQALKTEVGEIWLPLLNAAHQAALQIVPHLEAAPREDALRVQVRDRTDLRRARASRRGAVAAARANATHPAPMARSSRARVEVRAHRAPAQGPQE